MTRYLLIISLGPVQGFLAAARRTRDFWMGSAILAECAKAVARELINPTTVDPSLPACQQLIFPAVDRDRIDQDLKPIQFDKDNSQLHNAFDVSNVITALVDGNDNQMRSLSNRLNDTAQSRWREIAGKAAGYCQSHLRDDWKDQLQERLIEFYSAWTPFSIDSDYGDARRQVSRLLAGRKACRDFEWWTGKQLVPKSSLDGARETVLKVVNADQRRSRGRLRVKPNEQLDLIGLTKRVDWGHDAIRYPSVSRVAVEPFVAAISRLQATDREVAKLFRFVETTCEALRDLGALRKRKDQNPRGIEDDLKKFAWLKHFPFEGTPLFVSRHHEIEKELQDEASKPDESVINETAIQVLLRRLRTEVNSLQKACDISKPWEYAAFLVADGDGMGATLSKLAEQPNGLDLHRTFSKRQSEFATKARELINTRYGACFYAGADDVLAMVSVHRAIECARELHTQFHDHVGRFVADLKLPGITVPTLSVGIAIGHFMEPLEDLLDYARAAEHRAKNPNLPDQSRGHKSRNGLAIAIHARGGAAFTVRGHWGSTEAGAVVTNNHGVSDGFEVRLELWTRLHRLRLLPSKAAYDLREASRQYEQGWHNKDHQAAALQSDAARILGRKRGSSSVEARTLRNSMHGLLRQIRTADDLKSLAHELIAGQWIGDALDQAEGPLTVETPGPAEVAL